MAELYPGQANRANAPVPPVHTYETRGDGLETAQ